MKKNQLMHTATLGLLTLSLCGGSSIFCMDNTKQLLAQTKVAYNQADNVLKAAKGKVAYLEKSIKLIKEDINRTKQYEENNAKAKLEEALTCIKNDLTAANTELGTATTELTSAKQLLADAKSGKRTENTEKAKAFFKKIGDKFKNLKKINTTIDEEA